MSNSTSGSPTNNTDAELDERIKLAEISFKTVLDADLHEDDKANRILSAMAFLTAVATGLFVSIYSSSPSVSALKQALQGYVPPAQLSNVVDDIVQHSQKSSFIVFPAVIVFSCYILCILIGAIFFLVALGPNLNLSKINKTHANKTMSNSQQPPAGQSDEYHSLLFY